MTEDGGRIVVGVDGSEASKGALAWAVRQARISGAPVEAVMTWKQQPVYAADFSRELLGQCVREALGDDPGGVTVEQLVIEGEPVRTLVERSRTADLLVVGANGKKGLRRAVLGSVSRACVDQAHCTVVVTRLPAGG